MGEFPLGCSLRFGSSFLQEPSYFCVQTCCYRSDRIPSHSWLRFPLCSICKSVILDLRREFTLLSFLFSSSPLSDIFTRRKKRCEKKEKFHLCFSPPQLFSFPINIKSQRSNSIICLQCWRFRCILAMQCNACGEQKQRKSVFLQSVLPSRYIQTRLSMAGLLLLYIIIEKSEDDKRTPGSLFSCVLSFSVRSTLSLSFYFAASL